MRAAPASTSKPMVLGTPPLGPRGPKGMPPELPASQTMARKALRAKTKEMPTRMARMGRPRQGMSTPTIRTGHLRQMMVPRALRAAPIRVPRGLPMARMRKLPLVKKVPPAKRVP